MIERILRFLDDPAAGSFDELALAVFAFQVEHVEPYRRLCDSRGIAPGRIAGWREVPLVPAAAFKRLRLAAAPEREIFRSSGTSAGDEARSVHYHAYPELYRRTIDAAFPRHCLPLQPAEHPAHLPLSMASAASSQPPAAPPAPSAWVGSEPAGRAAPGAAPAAPRVPMLSLVPPRELLPDSSLSFMIDHVLARFGAPESVVACGRRGVEAAAARSWTAARQRAGRPALVLATSLALDQWLGALERLGLRFRLPAGSAVFETGGFKGRAVELTPARQLERLEERLDVPPSAVVREYGMTELTSQCYTLALHGGDPEVFVAPHWVRVRVLDPATLAEQEPGEPGLIAVFDLANLGSAAHLLTEDLGVLVPGPAGSEGGQGFHLLGRAAGAELRGCSLAAEELQRTGSG